MKKYLIPAISTIFAVLIIAIASILIFSDSKFVLSDEMYDSDGQIINIDIDELKEKIDHRKSFALLVSQPGCRTADDLRAIIREFATTHHITVYEIDYSGLKDSGLVPKLKFYPSFVVFKYGQPIDFLAADSNEDASAYTSYAGFETWFTSHITLRD